MTVSLLEDDIGRRAFDGFEEVNFGALRMLVSHGATRHRGRPHDSHTPSITKYAVCVLYSVRHAPVMQLMRNEPAHGIRSASTARRCRLKLNPVTVAHGCRMDMVRCAGCDEGHKRRDLQDMGGLQRFLSEKRVAHAFKAIVAHAVPD